MLNNNKLEPLTTDSFIAQLADQLVPFNSPRIWVDIVSPQPNPATALNLTSPMDQKVIRIRAQKQTCLPGWKCLITRVNNTNNNTLWFGSLNIEIVVLLFSLWYTANLWSCDYRSKVSHISSLAPILLADQGWILICGNDLCLGV